MERGKRVNVEFQLPEGIIQDIQSFLTRKEAAQTTVLAKAWHRAWSTRPDVDLDYRRFRWNAAVVVAAAAEDQAPQVPPPPVRFRAYARETMRRYEELNLTIDTFRLCMESAERDQRPLAGELIARAAWLGAKDIDIGFTHTSGKRKFVLPHNVLGSDNLVRLSVNGCTIMFGPEGRVNCPRLKFLGLSQVYVYGDVLWDIIKTCPLIEKLILSECKFLYNDTGRKSMTRLLDLRRYGFGAQNISNRSTTLYAFNRLTVLILSYVKIDPSFFIGFASKFPGVKDLTLSHCLGPKKIQISSPTLETIIIDQVMMLRARFDFPRLRKFNLSSSHIPTLTFGAVFGEWESCVYAGCTKYLSNSWFRHFRKFITMMRSSKLNLILYLQIFWQDTFDCSVGIPCRPTLDNLTINVPVFTSRAFWDGLFYSCRPEFITTSCSLVSDMGALEAACRRLTKATDDCYGANRSMFGQTDLEEVYLEIFDVTAAEWKPMTWKALLEGLYSAYEQRIRFHLTWSD